MKKSFFKFFTAICFLTLLASCDNDDEIVENGIIYMTQANESRAAYEINIADTAQIIAVGASYGGQTYPSQDIQVQFAVDTSLVSSYNSSKGTSFEPLPAGTYSLSATSATIAAGKTVSDPVLISIDSKDLPKDAQYLLPVKLVSASSGDINPNLQITYLRITVRRVETNLTSQGTLTVSKDHNDGPDAGEGSKKLVDGDNNSKFLTGGFPQDFWMQIDFPEAKTVKLYQITSGNDAPERDPKDWKLLGSNDGTTWTELDVQTEQMFSGRNQTVTYEIENETAYKQYRWQIDANNGSDLIQISEWRLITF